MNQTLEEVYTGLSRLRPIIVEEEVLTEEIKKTDKIVRFVIDATIDMSVNQDEIEEVYPYETYASDVQAGVSKKEMREKLGVITEDIAKSKIISLNQAAPNMDIEISKPPSINDSSFYRFSFELMLAEYEGRYLDEQGQTTSN